MEIQIDIDKSDAGRAFKAFVKNNGFGRQIMRLPFNHDRTDFFMASRKTGDKTLRLTMRRTSGRRVYSMQLAGADGDVLIEGDRSPSLFLAAESLAFRMRKAGMNEIQAASFCYDMKARPRDIGVKSQGGEKIPF
ncbi:MAG: hypothetical protein J6Y62_03955 [Clostridia bacterium]|nr:hypothetical protein [Clostridia bacterium]